MVPGAVARLGGRRLVVFKARRQLLNPRLAHQSLVDVTRRLLSITHGIGDVGRSGDKVAPGVELVAARLQRVAVILERAVLLDAEAGRFAEIAVDGLTHRQNYRVALEALNFLGGDGAAPAGGIEFSQAGLD